MNYNELKKLKNVEIVDDRTLRMKYDVDEYLDFAELQYDDVSGKNHWINKENDLVICHDGKHIMSTIQFSEDGNPVSASYCTAGNSSEDSECVDDAGGVVDFWIEYNK